MPNIYNLRTLYLAYKDLGKRRDRIAMPLVYNNQVKEFIMDELFKCTRCMDCWCKTAAIQLVEDEPDKMAEYLGESLENIKRKYILVKIDIAGIISWGINCPCPFLREDQELSICSIYDKRFIACREFPLGPPLKLPNGIELVTVECDCPAVWDILLYAFYRWKEAMEAGGHTFPEDIPEDDDGPVEHISSTEMDPWIWGK